MKFLTVKLCIIIEIQMFQNTATPLSTEIFVQIKYIVPQRIIMLTNDVTMNMKFGFIIFLAYKTNFKGFLFHCLIKFIIL